MFPESKEYVASKTFSRIINFSEGNLPKGSKKFYQLV